MLIKADTRDFADWWADELRALTPRAWQRFGRSGNHAEFVLRLERTGLCLSRPDGTGCHERSLVHDAVGLQDWLQTAGGRRSSRFDLRLAPDRFLQRKLAPFCLPKRRALAAATLDVPASTPLDPTSVLFLFGEGDGAAEGTRYFLAKTAHLQPIIDAIEGIGGSVAAISLETNCGITPVRREGYRKCLKRAGWEQPIRALTLMGVAACIVGAVLTFVHAQWRLRDGIDQIDTTIVALESEAKVVKALSEQANSQLRQIETARARKAQAVPVVRIWEEMTRTLPDRSWATDLAVKDGRVTFSGFSPSASELIPLLEASSLFADPTFAGPVSRAPETQSERFTIEMELEG